MLRAVKEALKGQARETLKFDRARVRAEGRGQGKERAGGRKKLNGGFDSRPLNQTC